MTRQREDSTVSTADLVGDDVPHQAQDPGVESELSVEETDDDVSLVDDEERSSFRQRWADAQGRFVDDPRAAVRDADALVAEVMQSLARNFAGRKAELEQQWSQEDEPDTEQLRQALQRYRLFFSRLLAT